MDLASAEAEIRNVFGDTPITEASIGAAPPDILVKVSVLYIVAILNNHTFPSPPPTPPGKIIRRRRKIEEK